MDDVKHVTDVAAAGTAFATVMHLMPEIAATFTVVWYVIRLVEWARKKLKHDKRPAG